jgi:hypothetical protein
MHLVQQTSDGRINKGAIPILNTYRAVVNRTGEERVLAGAELLNFIWATCNSLTYWTVLARMSFFRVA